MILQEPPQNGKTHGTVAQASVMAELIRESTTIL
jgi:hypothetical protein